MSCPVVVLDVDGVLAVDPDALPGGYAAVRALGYRAHEFDGLGPDGSHARGTVWLNPQHGAWLRELGDRGAELVWGTSWGRVAVTWIAPRLGLPEFPAVEVPCRGPAFGWSAKIGPIQRWAGDRPLVWIDDQLGGKEPGWAEERCADGIPTLIIQPHPRWGLERTHVEEILSWLDNEGASVPGTPGPYLSVPHHNEKSDGLRPASTSVLAAAVHRDVLHGGLHFIPDPVTREEHIIMPEFVMRDAPDGETYILWDTRTDGCNGYGTRDQLRTYLVKNYSTMLDPDQAATHVDQLLTYIDATGTSVRTQIDVVLTGSWEDPRLECKELELARLAAS